MHLVCAFRSFTSLCYSADGESVLAGGLSKFVCIYNIREQMLVKKFEISSNLSFDAMEVSWFTTVFEESSCYCEQFSRLKMKLTPKDTTLT